MTNQQVRQWYKAEVSRIPMLNEAWISEGLGLEERARKAWEIRHNARLKARDFMTDPKEVSLLQQRDMKKYGNPDGPAFEYLVAEARRRGLNDDSIYEEIIEESSTTNSEVDRKMDVD